jgi:hypothetical protein
MACFVAYETTYQNSYAKYIRGGPYWQQIKSIVSPCLTDTNPFSGIYWFIVPVKLLIAPFLTLAACPF